jgi:hypothetical protein
VALRERESVSDVLALQRYFGGSLILRSLLAKLLLVGWIFTRDKYYGIIYSTLSGKS